MAKAAIKESLFQVASADRIVFERLLGHREILGSSRWLSSTGPCCKICNKLCYSVFVWNHRVQDDTTRRYKFYKQSLAKPVVFEAKFENPYPVIVVNDKIHKMIPVEEYMERLYHGQQCSYFKFRACDSLVEAKKKEELTRKLRMEIKDRKRMHPTFYEDAQTIVQESTRYLEVEQPEPEAVGPQRGVDDDSEIASPVKKREIPARLRGITSWATEVSESMPPGTFEPVNLKEYGKLITETYEQLYPYPRGAARRADAE